MSTYDNLFTDRIFFGTQPTKSTNKSLDLSGANSLNLKLWKQLPLNKQLLNSISSTGSFFVVKTFSSADSQKIVNAIKLNAKVYFDNNGNLEVHDPSTNNISLTFKNPLNKIDFDPANKPNIFADSSGLLKTLPRIDFIPTNNMNWILYTENSICYILYNPIHRKSFQTYYRNQSKDISGANPSLQNLFNQYCEITSKQNDTSTLRTYADGACNCIRLDS